MTEPTPLSAERALNLLRMAARVDPLLRQAVADVELHIDAQATEIAALKDAREQIEGYRQALAQRGHVAEFREDGWSLEHPVECRAIGLIDCAVNLACGYEQTAPQLGRFVVTVNEDGFLVLGERVLAGKEAQCPKCEGRGFIRSMVDGERDSEPCSFCRMSGLAGKEAQGA